MEFGLFSNGARRNRIPADTYDADLFEIVAADRLGFREAWISEHLGQTNERRVDKVTVADLFIVKAAALTKQIRLGPGVRPVSMYHPVQVAIDATMCDQLTRGRYMAGFGVGGLPVNPMQQRGIDDPHPEVSARARMHEAIDLIVRCWTAPEPFDYQGAFWHGKGINIIPKPYQRPHPLVGVAVSKTMGTVEMAGRRGFMPIFSQFDVAEHMREMGDVLVEVNREAGREPHRSAIRVCRVVWVADNDEKAKREVRATMSASFEDDKREYPFHYNRYLPPSGRVEDVTFDYLVDAGHFVVGGPDTVYHRIKELYERSGGFGVFLMVTGKDYGTPRQRARSMRLFMQEVAPRLKDLDPDHSGAYPSDDLVPMGGYHRDVSLQPVGSST